MIVGGLLIGFTHWCFIVCRVILTFDLLILVIIGRCLGDVGGSFYLILCVGYYIINYRKWYISIICKIQKAGYLLIVDLFWDIIG